MPLNGSGSYAAPASTWNPAVDGTNINSTDWAALLADISTALSTALYKDGQQTATVLVPFAQGITVPSSTKGNVYSNTYTPTMTAGTNCDSVTTMAAQWMRVGNMVMVSGTCNFDPTSGNASSDWLISLPVASVFTNALQGGGVLATQAALVEALSIFSDSASGKMKVAGLCGNTVANHTCSYSFMYQVL